LPRFLKSAAVHELTLRGLYMESRAKFLGHPVHQMLVVFPVGLLAMAAVFDVIHLMGQSAEMARVAYWMIAAGVLSGLVVAPFGFVDWLAIPSGTRAKFIGGLHGAGNVLVLIMFAASWVLRYGNQAQPSLPSLVLSFAGVVMAGVTAWLGGELVSRLGVGVSPEAGLDAPSSLHHEHRRSPVAGR
jgi:uncharacterized membrane protein